MRRKRLYMGLAITLVSTMITSASMVSASTYTVTLKDDDKAYILNEADLAPECWDSMTEDEKKDYIKDLLENHKDSIKVTALTAPTPSMAAIDAVQEDIAAEFPADIPEATEVVQEETGEASVDEITEEPADEFVEESTEESTEEPEEASKDGTSEDVPEGNISEESSESADESSSAEVSEEAVDSERAEDELSENAGEISGDIAETTADVESDPEEAGEEVDEEQPAVVIVDDSLERGDLGVNLLATLAADTEEEAYNGDAVSEPLNQSAPGSTDLVGGDKKPSGSSGSNSGSSVITPTGTSSNGSSDDTGKKESAGNSSATSSVKTTTPKTGDESQPLMYLGMLLGAAFIGGITVFGRKKS